MTTKKNESTKKNVTIEDIKSIVAEMDAYFEAHPEMKDEIYRNDISLRDYQCELVSLVLDGAQGTSFYAFSEDEFSAVDEIVNAVTDSAATWNNPLGLYDYLRFEQIDRHECTGLYDRLYGAVIDYWVYIVEHCITTQKVVDYLNNHDEWLTEYITSFYQLDPRDDDFEDNLFKLYCKYDCVDKYNPPFINGYDTCEWCYDLNAMVTSRITIFADDLIDAYHDSNSNIAFNIIYSIIDAD